MQARVAHQDDMMATGLLMDTTFSAAVLQILNRQPTFKGCTETGSASIGKEAAH